MTNFNTLKKYIIAIDGPASSGKSTVAKGLAKHLHYVYLDTGAMYRTCALYAKEKGIELTDISSLTEMMSTIDIHIEYCDTGNKVFLNDKEVTEAIREPEISKLASDISAIGVVRTGMTNLQRKLGQDGGIVMDGRDIGTVVFPHADYKFFMNADVHVRAKRRWIEEKEKGSTKTLLEVENELKKRDYNDSHREIAPLKQADDAIVIDSTNMSIEEQVPYFMKFININEA